MLAQRSIFCVVMTVLISCGVSAFTTQAREAAPPPAIKQLPGGILETPWYLSSLEWRFFEGKTPPTDLSKGDSVTACEFWGSILNVRGIGRKSKDWRGEGWFVTQFRADSILSHTKHLIFWLHRQDGESTLWLDGRKLKSFTLDERFPRRDIFFTADDLDSGIRTLAIHHRDSAAQSAFQHFGAYADATAVGISISGERSVLTTLNDIRQIEQFFIAVGAALFLLVILHSLIFAFSPTEKAHLFYAIETACLMCMILKENVVLFFSPTEPAAAWAWAIIILRALQLLIIPALVAMLTSLFYPQRLSQRHRYLLIGYGAVCIICLLGRTLYSLLSGEMLPDKILLFVIGFPTTLGLVEIVRLLIVGVRTSRGAWLIASGGVLFLIAAFSVLSKMVVAGTAKFSFGIEFLFAGMGFQLGMSLFLAWQSAQTRRNLTQSLLEQERERFRAESLAREAAFTALKMQINPHFLFNALASIRTLSRIQPETAHEAISQLSALFRYALQSAQQETVTLREELSIVRDYLALESLRFEDRLQSSFHIPPELESLPIPPMTLQILVENAVKHGIEEERHGGRISLHAALEQGELRLRVLNTGVLRQSTRGNGIGLANARERLRMMFGTSADITLQEIHHAEGGSEVCAEVRYLPSEQNSQKTGSAEF